MTKLTLMTADAPKPDDVTAIREWMRWPDNAPSVTLEGVADWVNRRPVAAFERLAADNVRLTQERDEARAVLAAADKGTPIYRAVERVLDEHSAWIADPREDVTKAIALAAGVAWMAAEKVDPNLEEIDRALAAARAENDRLREALRPFAREAQFWDHAPDDVRLGVSCVDGFVDSGDAMFFPGHFRRARAALEQGGGNGE